MKCQPLMISFLLFALSATFVLADEEQTLDLVQKRTFDYCWEQSHPRSGLIRERTSTPNTTTIGGTGFQLMALIVGDKRGYASHRKILARMSKILNSLERSTRYHGAFSHWIYGNTDETKPFSKYDDGGDLVETALLIQGLLCVRQYFSGTNPIEVAIREKADDLWHAVDWQFYTRGEEHLYWHWSPNYGWKMNLPITGWNEALITYVLAASSPSHPISAEVYHNGWARQGKMKNGKSYCDIELPLGPPFGGPLFLSHYSFLGLDPRGLTDRYADYWKQNVNHTLINWTYCMKKGYVPAWGLTASDTPSGYAAHSPTEDRGVITPTAALSAIVYTPHKSMKALRHFRETMSGRLFGPWGFVDAYQPSTGWIARDQLAIDQGPIIIMIENHRSGLLWKLFMSCPEIINGLRKLGFERKINE